MNETEKSFLHRNKLGLGYLSQANKWFLPIMEKLQPKLKKRNQPLVLGISGSQGSGKSALADYLCTVAASQFNINALSTSIDDFYHTKNKRNQLGQEIHPLLVTRGVPGTHDIELAMRILDGLVDGSEDVLVPRFDKTIDDRCNTNEFIRVSKPLDLIVLEGWCLGAKAQKRAELEVDINNLEREFDPNFIWRKYVNNCIAEPYQKLFNYIDRWIMLRAPSFDQVLIWRLEQEQKLMEKHLESGIEMGHEIMSPLEINSFVQHYQRVTEFILGDLPTRVHHLYQLDKDRIVVKYRQPLPEI